MSPSRQKKYSFSAKVWKYKGPAGWHFVTLPRTLTKKIRARHLDSEAGWGRLSTTARVGKTKWKTAIWYDTKAKSYLLALKGAIRKSEKISEGQRCHLQLFIEFKAPTPFGL